MQKLKKKKSFTLCFLMKLEKPHLGLFSGTFLTTFPLRIILIYFKLLLNVVAQSKKITIFNKTRQKSLRGHHFDPITLGQFFFKKFDFVIFLLRWEHNFKQKMNFYGNRQMDKQTDGQIGKYVNRQTGK